MAHYHADLIEGSAIKPCTPVRAEGSMSAPATDQGPPESKMCRLWHPLKLLSALPLESEISAPFSSRLSARNMRDELMMERRYIFY